MLKSIIAAAIFCSFSFNATAAETHYKDGKQFTIELAYRLGISASYMLDFYKSNRQNLPKDKDESSLISGIQALAKIATAGCSYSADLNEGILDIDGIYQLLVLRAPTDYEKSQALIGDDGSVSFFANCVELALSPEMVEIPSDESSSQNEVTIYDRR